MKILIPNLAAALDLIRQEESSFAALPVAEDSTDGWGAVEIQNYIEQYGDAVTVDRLVEIGSVVTDREVDLLEVVVQGGT